MIETRESSMSSRLPKPPRKPSKSPAGSIKRRSGSSVQAMLGADLRAALAQLGLSQRALAGILRRDPQTIFRWCADEREIPPEAEALLRLLLDGTITTDDIERALRNR